MHIALNTNMNVLQNFLQKILTLFICVSVSSTPMLSLADGTSSGNPEHLMNSLDTPSDLELFKEARQAYRQAQEAYRDSRSASQARTALQERARTKSNYEQAFLRLSPDLQKRHSVNDLNLLRLFKKFPAIVGGPSLKARLTENERAFSQSPQLLSFIKYTRNGGNKVSAGISSLSGYRSLTPGQLERLRTEARERQATVEAEIIDKEAKYLADLQGRAEELSAKRAAMGRPVDVEDLKERLEKMGMDKNFMPDMKNPGIQIGLESGTRYTFVPDSSGVPQPVALEDVSAEEMKKAMHQPIGTIGALAKRTLKRFPAEFLRFNIAQAIVMSVACFGNQTFLTELRFKASYKDPVCIDNFITMLLDVNGMIGFYFFMVANDATTKGLNNMMNRMLALVEQNTTTRLTQMRPKILNSMRPLFGYVGMAVGSAVSGLVHEVLALDKSGECIEGLMRGQLITNKDCKATINHLVSKEKLWHNQISGLPALVGSAMLASATQKAGSGLYKGAKKIALLSMPKGMSQKMALRALEKALNAGTAKASQPILTQLGSKVGYVMRVTGAGALAHFTFFLAWDHLIREETMAWYYHWLYGYADTWNGLSILTLGTFTKDNGLEENINSVFSDIDDLLGMGLSGPGYVTSCKKNNVITPAHSQYTPKQQKEICTTPPGNEVPISKSLNELHNNTSKYRQHAIMAGLMEGAANWKSKWASYFEKFTMGRSILEFISGEREVRVNTKLSTEYVLDYITSFWYRALKIRTQEDYEKLVNKEYTGVQGIADEVKDQFIDFTRAKGTFDYWRYHQYELQMEYKRLQIESLTAGE